MNNIELESDSKKLSSSKCEFEEPQDSFTPCYEITSPNTGKIPEKDESEIHVKDKLFTLTIEISEGIEETIDIFSDDSPEDIANNFLAEHNLSMKLQYPLILTIRNKILEHKSKLKSPIKSSNQSTNKTLKAPNQGNHASSSNELIPSDENNCSISKNNSEINIPNISPSDEIVNTEIHDVELPKFFNNNPKENLLKNSKSKIKPLNVHERLYLQGKSKKGIKNLEKKINIDGKCNLKQRH